MPEKREIREELNMLIKDIRSMSSWGDFDSKTIVYWCIGTYGRAMVRKFPILMIRGPKETGKSTTLDIIKALGMPSPTYTREDMLQVGSMSEPVTKQILGRRGALLIDEADWFLEDMVLYVFDSKIGKYQRNVKQKDGTWLAVSFEINVALALCGRDAFNDPANDSRCITLIARPTDLGADDKIQPDMRLIEPYEDTIKEISEELCDWESISESSISRSHERWAVISHVAEVLGDGEYLELVAERIEKEREDSDSYDEPEIGVFRAVLGMAGDRDVDGRFTGFKDKVLSKVIKKIYNEDRPKAATTHAVNAIACGLGFEKYQYSSDIYISIPVKEDERLEFMRAIARKIGYEDGALFYD